MHLLVVEVCARGLPYSSIGRPSGDFSVDASVFSVMYRSEEVAVDMRGLYDNMTRDMRDEVKELDAEILSVVRSLAGNVGRYKRERNAGVKAIVSEIYSSPRTTAAIKLLPELRLIPGFALDFTTVDEEDGAPWDFDDPRKREKALAKLRHECPMLLVGSPMCTAFSSWQRISDKVRDPAVCAAEKARALVHLSFCVQL